MYSRACERADGLDRTLVHSLSPCRKCFICPYHALPGVYVYVYDVCACGIFFVAALFMLPVFLVTSSHIV
jgi:hypothetical protein